ncbi:MAG: hypothetical protein GF317_17810 [Candidatus Lokiarchaeota archaeon]|nr:hypothetical protein [Candidatus Lokiarchaeota archaeon]MBD3201369.1 hypothetical protein [Candidatus Lokiarchaeota archaeon]
MSKDFLDLLWNKLDKNKIINKEIIQFLDKYFSEKSDKIFEVIKKGITKYAYFPSNRILWTALGKQKEHIIYPRLYCSCRDFYKSVVINQSRKFCKHLIAQVIAESLGNFEYVKLEDDAFLIRIEEIKSDF